MKKRGGKCQYGERGEGNRGTGKSRGPSVEWEWGQHLDHEICEVWICLVVWERRRGKVMGLWWGRRRVVDGVVWEMDGAGKGWYWRG